MLNYVSFKELLKNNEDAFFCTAPFFYKGQPLTNEVHWGTTLLTAGTMRFRWNEENPNRQEKLNQILKEVQKSVCSGSCVSEKKVCDCKKQFVPVELIHSKIVIEAKKADDTKNIQADGIVTQNKMLIPAVTVADCVPLYLFDTRTKATGVFHSGWKGTGIIAEGVKKIQELYGSKPEDLCAAIGPHIDQCCYNVDKERADYFITNFTKDCITPLKSQDKKFPYALSLTLANLQVLKNSGIPEENIVIASDCTCCQSFSKDKYVFGSFRRQAAPLPPETDPLTRSKSMTVQAAFII